MKHSLWKWFAAASILLSDAMCAVVAYVYCDLLWCGRHGLCSAPASTAFLLAVPFAVGIALCIFLSIYCLRKGKE